MLVLQDMVAFLREERAHDHFNFKAAGLSCLNGSLAINVGACIRLVRADNDHARATMVERLDIAEHATTAIAMQSELTVTAPLPQGAVEFAGNLFEDHSAYDSSASQNAASAVGFADAIEPGREQGSDVLGRDINRQYC